MDFDFELNLKTRDKRVLLTAGIKEKLDLRVLFSIVSLLKEREIEKGSDIEEFQEFQILGDKMENNHSRTLIVLPCQIESAVIYASIEVADGEKYWVIMYEDEFEGVVRWNICA